MGNVFTNDMTEDNDRIIYEIHFCTSYTQVLTQSRVVNDEGETIINNGEIFIECGDTADDLAKALDFVAIPSGSNGEWADLCAI